MKIAIIADIHANHAALEAVLNDVSQRNIDEIISLGDNIGYGPDPQQVVTTLQDAKIVSILGNHEYGLQSELYLKRLNPDPQKSLILNRDLLSPAGLSYCQALQPLLFRHGARFVHGCPPKSYTAYLYRPRQHKLERLYHGFTEQLCFFGHTHAPTIFKGAERIREVELYKGSFQLEPKFRYIINPGSVGQPRDNVNNRAKYLIWDPQEGTLVFRAIAYNVAATVEKLRRLGFPDFNAERLLL